jgi:hypothetical protein
MFYKKKIKKNFNKIEENMQFRRIKNETIE